MIHSSMISDSAHISSVTVRYSDSNQFDHWHYIHKYYLTPEDKKRVFPVDIQALNTMADFVRTDAGYEHVAMKYMDLLHKHCSPKQPAVSVYYIDLQLSKLLEGKLVFRILQAIEAYQHDVRQEPTTEETVAVLAFNEQLKNYEKNMVCNQLKILKKHQKIFQSIDPSCFDYNIELNMELYLRDNIFLCTSIDVGDNDWDRDIRLMTMVKLLFTSFEANRLSTPNYWGIGDDHDHNDARGILRNTPVYNVKHCYLFHVLLSHNGIPIRHLPKIDKIHTEIMVNHQSMSVLQSNVRV